MDADLSNCFIQAFPTSFAELGKSVAANAMAHGFLPVDGPDWVNQAKLIALMHSELSEALEAIRDGNPPSEKCPGFSHVEEELADVVIRIMDFSAQYGLNVGGAVHFKHEFNKTRPFKHGRKAF